MQDPVQFITDSTSLALRFQGATGFAFPPVIPLKETVKYTKLGRTDSPAELKNRLKSGLAAIAAVNWQMPMTLELIDSDALAPFTLPVDPVVGFSGKNIVVRRQVAKSNNRGSVKERFGQDDWSVDISGVLLGTDSTDLYEQMETLRLMCELGRNGISVTNELMNNYMDIYQLVVENFDFPFTKGAESQLFTLKCYSDDVYTLLEEA